MTNELSNEFLPEWIRSDGAENDVAVSSRVRLARNLKDIPFPGRAKPEDLAKVHQQVAEAISRQSGIKFHPPLKLEELTPNQRLTLMEKHLCSPQFIEDPQERMLIIDEPQTIGVMVNEEDHLRIQSISPGFSVEQALNLANRVDDLLEESLDYCFDEQYGYLTACPTNTGTGLRASMMLHLPGLAMVDRIKQVLSALTHVGINVRGLYGEGTEALGNMYQISNQVSLGESEIDLVNNLQSVCRRVIEEERGIRQALLKESRLQLEDRICRSYGILSNARLLTTQESLKLLSDVKLGMDLGIIKNLKQTIIKELMFLTRTSILQQDFGQEMTPLERDQYRAQIIKDKIKGKRGDQHA